ncbi:hypothetical protein [Actinoplanes sp. DH11]|uniref:hypothetical protein n=1 Tax=Actinoplanes sp. DH11 TaxID=2857011 RepID=UPI001E32A363|nr:hypothetical protein [Actinoplanes sp. DH11]
MGAESWVILEAGTFASAALAVAAWLFALQGVEFASWFAGVAGVVVGLGAIILAPQASHPAAPPPDPLRPGTPPALPVSAPPAAVQH